MMGEVQKTLLRLLADVADNASLGSAGCRGYSYSDAFGDYYFGVKLGKLKHEEEVRLDVLMGDSFDMDYPALITRVRDGLHAAVWSWTRPRGPSVYGYCGTPRFLGRHS